MACCAKLGLLLGITGVATGAKVELAVVVGKARSFTVSDGVRLLGVTLKFRTAGAGALALVIGTKPAELAYSGCTLVVVEP